MYCIKGFYNLKGWAQLGSNQRPPDYESGALIPKINRTAILDIFSRICKNLLKRLSYYHRSLLILHHNIFKQYIPR